jgi:anti-anti-sigma factor
MTPGSGGATPLETQMGLVFEPRIGKSRVVVGSSPRGSSRLLAPAGALDAYGVAELRRSLSALSLQGDSDIVLDHTHVDYVDSFGLGALAQTVERLRAKGATLSIAVAPEAAKELLKVIGLRDLPVYATVPSHAGEAEGDANHDL